MLFSNRIRIGGNGICVSQTRSLAGLKVRVLLMTVCLLWLLLVAASARAEVLSQQFDHSLGFGQESQNYEHRIDLPDALAQQGFVFNKRSLALTDKLTIVREEFTRTYYYVKVRLLKGKLLPGKGSLTVTLEAGRPVDAPQSPAPVSPEISGDPLQPKFNWRGSGIVTAVSIYDRLANRNIWERVILGKTQAAMDEGRLYPGSRYVLGISQSDGFGRYSTPVLQGFRIDERTIVCSTCRGSGKVYCLTCNGTGWVSNSPSGMEPCLTCHGTGRLDCPNCAGSGKVREPFIALESAY